MMPSAPFTMMLSPGAKPKIGFSIDSIVGDRLKSASTEDDSNDAAHENLPKLPTSPTDLRREYSHLMKRSRQQMTPSPHNPEPDNTSTRLSESSDQDIQNNNTNRPLKQSPSRSPSPPYQKGPIVVPGIPAGLMNRTQLLAPPHSHQLPPYAELPPGHPHFMQFQAAAALVHAQAAQTGFSGGMPHHFPHLHNPNMGRESYPGSNHFPLASQNLYPWLLSRHGRIFPHRFPGSKWTPFFFFCLKSKPQGKVNNETLNWSANHQTLNLLSHLIKNYLICFESIYPPVFYFCLPFCTHFFSHSFSPPFFDA